MAFNAAGVQGTGDTDADLTGLSAVTGVTTRSEGRRTIYVFASGVGLQINGTLTINPEIESIVTTTQEIVLDVRSGGLLNLGTTITESNDVPYERYSNGVALSTNALPDPSWWTDLNLSPIRVRSGGSCHWRGATVVATVGLYFDDGCSLLIQDGVMRCPPIGGLVSGNAGRGVISWIKTADCLIDGFRMENGGELLFDKFFTGTNGIDSSLTNGFFGYSAIATVYGLFPNNLENALLINTSVANNGNLLDATIQTDHTLRAAGLVANTKIVNEAGGTSLLWRAGETGFENRNFGIGRVFRDINFSITDLTGAVFSGGRWFIRDTNNGLRKNVNSFSSLDDNTYSNVFSSGSSTTTEVLLGVVNATNTGGNLTRNVSNEPSSTLDIDAQFRYDLRGKVNTLGSDLFDVHTWIYEYQYQVFSNTDLSDGTVGTRIIRGAYPADNSITRERTGVDGITALNDSISTDFVVTADKITTTSTAVTLDDVYDLVKFRKETSPENLQIPSVSTLVLTSDGTEIDMGSNTITQGSGQWSVGTTHTQFKVVDDINLSKFVLGGGIGLSCIQFSTVPSSFDNCSLTNSSTTATAGGKTLGSDVVINGDWTYSSAGNVFNHTQTGDITVGDGDNTYGTDFELTGELLLSTGNNTFDSGTDVSNVDLISLGGKAVAVFGKVAADFKSINDTRTGSSITFPAFPTRLDVNISALGTGVPYTLCHNGVIVSSGLSTGTSLQFSNGTSDGSRTQVAEIGGNWSLGIVDADKRCTFNAIDVVVTVESQVTQFTLSLPSFNSTFNVAITEIGSRTCIVGDTDVVTTVGSTNIGVQLTGDFPSDSLSNVLNFNNSANAITFMEALGLTSSTARQTTSGNIFLRTGTTPQDFTGVELQRLDSQVAIRSGIATYSSGIVTVSLEGSVDIFISTGYTAEVVFEIEGCIGNSYADQPMTSNMFGKARDSINYIEAMRRRLIKNKVTIPTDGSSVTEDICRSVNDGADIRNGTYLLQDTEIGVQLVDGLRDVDNVPSFSPGTKSERQLRDLNTGIESDGFTHKVRTTSRLVVSSSEIGAATVGDLKEWGNDLTNNVKASDFTSQTTGIPTQL